MPKSVENHDGFTEEEQRLWDETVKTGVDMRRMFNMRDERRRRDHDLDHVTRRDDVVSRHRAYSTLKRARDRAVWRSRIRRARGPLSGGGCGPAWTPRRSDGAG